MATIIIEGNTFHTGSSAIQNNFEAGSIDPALIVELSEMKKKLTESDPLKPAAEDVEKAVKSKDWKMIKDTILKHVPEFTTTAFANLASAGLIAFINQFL